MLARSKPIPVIDLSDNDTPFIVQRNKKSKRPRVIEDTPDVENQPQQNDNDDDETPIVAHRPRKRQRVIVDDTPASEKPKNKEEFAVPETTVRQRKRSQKQLESNSKQMSPETIQKKKRKTPSTKVRNFVENMDAWFVDEAEVCDNSEDKTKFD